MRNDTKTIKPADSDIWRFSGMAATPLRLITGWLFFSAFWRRVVLAPGKLAPHSAGYVGHKIVTFIPHALWFKSMIQFTVTHAGLLYVFLIVFTAIEALAGLAMLVGFATRLASFAIASLSFGILMGAGWLGSTCLDEWQIGVAGIGAGMLIFVTGAGPWSIDAWWQKKYPGLTQKGILRWLTSGPLTEEGSALAGKIAAVFAILALGLTLYTNQAFHGGVFGKLHNDSKKPLIKFSQVALDRAGNLQFTLYRTNGPDTYGSFLVAVKITTPDGKVVESFSDKQLAAIPKSAISNTYINKVHTGPFSLVVPLGAQASIRLQPAAQVYLPQGQYQVNLFDISGTHWQASVSVP